LTKISKICGLIDLNLICLKRERGGGVGGRVGEWERAKERWKEKENNCSKQPCKIFKLVRKKEFRR
jgi:hypothetical protein